MSFGDEFLFTASKYVEVKSVEADLAFTTNLVKSAVKLISERNKLIKEKDVSIYMHGSYANRTNIFFPSNLEVCVELKVPKYESVMSNDYYIVHDLPYTPQDFRNELYDAINEVIAIATKKPNIAPTECDYNDKCILIPKFGNLKHIVEVTPCLSFILTEGENASEFAGVLLYDAGIKRDIATFPLLHQRNGQLKDIKCEGNFKKMVRFFKTLNVILGREFEYDIVQDGRARGYFIECLLYNVPDAMFIGIDQNDVFLKIINYLNHADIRNFVCQNLVWSLFGSAREFWSEHSANTFIRSVKQLYKVFPIERTDLVIN